MTYREHIQQLKRQFEDLYDKAGWLRDCADLSEKKTWNTMRDLNRAAADALGNLDNHLSDDRAKMELDNIDENPK
jgi:hypothetical protein